MTQYKETVEDSIRMFERKDLLSIWQYYIIVDDNIFSFDSSIEVIQEALTETEDDTVIFSDSYSIRHLLSQRGYDDGVYVRDGFTFRTTHGLSESDTLKFSNASDEATGFTTTVTDNIMFLDEKKLTRLREHYVYDTYRDSWTKFYFNNKIKQGVVLDEGENNENVNLLLNDVYKDGVVDTQGIYEYPTSTAITNIPYIKIKDTDMEKGTLRRVYLDYDGDSADIESIVDDKSHLIQEIEAKQWRGIANEKSSGSKFTVVVYDADVIKYLDLDYKIRVVT